MSDPYQYYIGQQGYLQKPISKADEKNVAWTHCQLSLQTPQPRDSLPDVCQPPSIHEYLPLASDNTTKTVSCQYIAPSYYPDMTQGMIGKCPVYTTRNCEYNVPRTIMTNREQLTDRDFSCLQPQWGSKCM